MAIIFVFDGKMACIGWEEQTHSPQVKKVLKS
jgi:hypothetical protein